MQLHKEEYEAFITELQFHAAKIDELYGAVSTLEQGDEGHGGTLEMTGLAGQHATFRWEPDLLWHIAVRSDQYTYERSGRYPENHFSIHLLRAARNIREFPQNPPRTTQALRYLLGAVPIAMLLVLVKTLAISYRKEDSGSGIRVEVAQQILSNFGFDDWFNIALGTLLTSPAPAALLAALIAWLLYVHSRGEFPFPNDAVSWRSGVAMMLSFSFFVVAVALGEWCFKGICVIVATLFLYSNRIVSPAVQLARLRKLGAYFEHSHSDGEAQDIDSFRASTGMSVVQAGALVKSEAEEMLVDLHTRRDKAVDDPDFDQKWNRVATLAIALDATRDATRSRRKMFAQRVLLVVNKRLAFERSANGLLYIALLALPLSGALVLNPSPWTPVVCLHRSAGDISAFSIGGDPLAYLAQDSRDVIFDVAGASVTFGECASD